jgi:hypothetical protein
MLLGASNSWFAVTSSALSLPRATDELGELVDQHWSILSQVTSTEVLHAFRAVGQLEAFKGVDDDAMFAAIADRRDGVETEQDESLKQAEWDLLIAQSLPRRAVMTARAVEAPVDFKEWIERVVLVERLREVQALIGFTRVESPRDDRGTGTVVKITRGTPEWLPAAEVRGEGIFVQLRESAVREWIDQSESRAADFLASHTAWCARRGILEPELGFPGLRLVLVHSLAHALMRRLVLESGYSQASIRERLYAAEGTAVSDAMAGFLLYTAASDSEGTLGGLVALGERDELRHHLHAAIRDAELCASDPLCAEHSPDDDGSTLHGAACHACLFAPETSCELGNRYLDRAALTSLVTGTDGGLFTSIVTA